MKSAAFFAVGLAVATGTVIAVSYWALRLLADGIVASLNILSLALGA